MPAVPETVKFDDFQTAVKPLLDLCGVTPNQILADIHITPSPDQNATVRINLLVVAPANGDEGEGNPIGFHFPNPPQPFTQLVYPVVIDVLTLLPHDGSGREASEGVR